MADKAGIRLMSTSELHYYLLFKYIPCFGEARLRASAQSASPSVLLH